MLDRVRGQCIRSEGSDRHGNPANRVFTAGRRDYDPLKRVALRRICGVCGRRCPHPDTQAGCDAHHANDNAILLFRSATVSHISPRPRRVEVPNRTNPTSACDSGSIGEPCSMISGHSPMSGLEPGSTRPRSDRPCRASTLRYPGPHLPASACPSPAPAVATAVDDQQGRGDRLHAQCNDFSIHQ